MPGLDHTSVTAARPRIHRLRILAAAVAIAALSVVATPGISFAWAVSSFSAADEQHLFTLTNQDRASAGLNVLTNDNYLHNKAEWRAQDMGDNGYFSHTIPPDGKLVFYYMSKDGYCYKVAGENIGVSTYGDADATTHIEAAFMGSSSHRANILGTWARMGIGAYKGPDGRKLYAVLFSIPCGVTVPTPPPVVTPAPTLGPDQTPVPVKTAAPTPRATPRPTSATRTATPLNTPSASPSATASPSPTESASPAPTPSPTPEATPTASPSASPSPTPVPAVTPGPVSLSLRVRPEPAPPGPLQSFLDWLFGDLFHW
jgi:uncharacterized protein YkwD